MDWKSTIDFGKVNEAKDGAILKGLGIGGLIILEASNGQIPHEDGDLERTGAVSVEGRKAAISYRDVAYKGQATDQHENMALKHDPGRNAKFLERAMNANRDVALDAVAGQLRKVFGV